jgi:deoxyadenosine/deoxycytidine kinase
MKIVIDGLIGAGKSTQAELISGFFDLKVVKEPIDDWPLDLFYENPKRWGFLMQTAVLSSFSSLRYCDGIFERSPQSSKEVFWKNLVQSGVVTKTEDEVFQRLFSSLEWKPDVTIYVSTPPEVCYRHIQARGQTGDAAVSMEYLNTLDAYYTRYIANHDGTVHVVDGDRSVEEVNEQILKILNRYINKDTHQTGWTPQTDVFM